jgi:thiamine-phosphate pyrophosphorylase
VLPQLIVITDWSLGRELLLSRLSEALSLGPQVAVQHRHPEATGRQFFEEAKAVAELAQRFGNPLFINARLDVALLLGAHVHLRAEDPAAGQIRRHLPPGRWISRAVHSEQEAGWAREVDLALVSPVFPTRSKSMGERAALGREGFSRLAKLLPCPAFALGGVSPQNAAGLKRAAVIGSVLHAERPKAVAAELLARL